MKPIHRRKSQSSKGSTDVTRVGNVDGEYHGESVCFTGRLPVVRRDAADMAASLGFDVHARVTKRTTFLVVGIPNPAVIVGPKSLNHRRAEKWAAQGTGIQVITGTDFLAMVPEDHELLKVPNTPDRFYSQASMDPMFCRRGKAARENNEGLILAKDWPGVRIEVSFAIDDTSTMSDPEDAWGPDPDELAWSEEHGVPLLGMTMLCAWALKALVVLHERGQTPASSAEVSACAEIVAKPEWGPSMETSSFTSRLKGAEAEGLVSSEKRGGRLYWTPTARALEELAST